MIRSTVFGFALVCQSASGVFAEGQKWDMPMAYSPTNYHSENGAYFADCVNGKKTGLEIVVHTAGTLFKGHEIKNAVQLGQASIGERLISAHLDENPIYGIDSVPFLASSFEASDALLRAGGDRLQQALSADNLTYIYSVPWPPQGIYFKKEISGLADMAGVKFRAYNQSTNRLAELTGMATVKVEVAKLKESLAEGKVEAFISSGATGFDRKVWQNLTHFYNMRAWLPRNVVFANKDAWQKLDAVQQGALADCGAEAQKRGTRKAVELTKFYLKGLTDNGMVIREPDEALSSELQNIGDKMTEDWLKIAGSGGKAIIDAYRNR